MRKMNAAAVLAVGALSLATVAPSAAVADPYGPSISWGASVQAAKGEKLPAATVRFQGDVGRSLRAERDFLSWNSPFPTAYEKGLAAAGTTVLLSVRTRNVDGTLIPWASIAAAQPGDPLYLQMQSWADRIRDFAVPIYVTFQHEPEAAINNTLGTSADYVAAWQKWVTILRTEGATNAKAMWITTAFAYTVKQTDRRLASNWYPGDAYVDAIGADAYNWFTCRTGITTAWMSLQQLIEGMRKFSLLHPTQELWVTEYASVEDPATPGRRAQWISDAEALFQQPAYSRFRGVLYFEQNKAPCDWRVENTLDALAALTTMGADPYYAG
jgi:Glycosyl hydrolase family 26